MTALAIRTEVDNYRSSLDALVIALRSVNNLADLTEVRARVEAAKAWAKVHGQVKALRLDLLRVEVNALVRIAELGGADTLSSGDAAAARWLAAMGEAEREALVAESGTATTAYGMCRAIWREEEIKLRRVAMRRAGIEFATEPEPPVYDEDAIKSQRRYVVGVGAALANLVETYTEAGAAFSVGDMADAVIVEAGLDTYEGSDADFRQAVHEVCRTALRAAPPLTLEGTVIPKFITCQTPEGDWVRIPTPNALVAHLNRMVELRRDQLRQDTEALDRLVAFADRIKAHPGVTDETRIGDVIEASLEDDEEDES